MRIDVINFWVIQGRLSRMMRGIWTIDAMEPTCPICGDTFNAEHDVEYSETTDANREQKCVEAWANAPLVIIQRDTTAPFYVENSFLCCQPCADALPPQRTQTQFEEYFAGRIALFKQGLHDLVAKNGSCIALYPPTANILAQIKAGDAKWRDLYPVGWQSVEKR